MISKHILKITFFKKLQPVFFPTVKSFPIVSKKLV